MRTAGFCIGGCSRRGGVEERGKGGMEDEKEMELVGDEEMMRCCG